MKIHWWAKVRSENGSIITGPFISQEDAWDSALNNQPVLATNAPIDGTIVWCTKENEKQLGNIDESLPINRKPRRHNDE